MSTCFILKGVIYSFSIKAIVILKGMDNMIKIYCYLLLGCVLLLTACVSSHENATNLIPTKIPIDNDNIIGKSVSISMPASPSLTSSFAVTSTEEICSNIIGRIILRGQDYAELTREPNPMSDTIDKLTTDQKVVVIGRHNNPPYWMVDVKGMSGWVYAQDIFIAGDITTIPCIPASSMCQSPISQIDYDKAISAIRSFIEQPNLSLFFQDIISDPNADLRQMMVFADDQGAQYYVDLSKSQVVEYLPYITSQINNLESKQINELQELATNVALRSSSTFQQRTDLIFTSATKDNKTFAFRWEEKNFLDNTTRSFLQIVLRSDGAIVNYINTLDIWER